MYKRQGGHYVKRQLALAHVIFNLFVEIGAFFLLLPMLPWAVAAFGLSDPLYSLVAFHSVFNLIGLTVFIPLLRPYSAWIGRRFDGRDVAQPSLLGLPVDVPDAALLATARLLKKMRTDAAVLSLQTFNIKARELQLPTPIIEELQGAETPQLSLENRYQAIKHMESELLAFSMDLQAQPLTPQQVALLSRQGAEARAIVYSSKTLKDIRHNLLSMRESVLPAVKDLYQQHRSHVQRFYQQLLERSTNAQPEVTRAAADEDSLLAMLADNEAQLQATNAAVRDIAARDLITGSELSNMLNVNREMHHAIKSLLTQT